jgi:hypothetical protein
MRFGDGARPAAARRPATTISWRRSSEVRQPAPHRPRLGDGDELVGRLDAGRHDVVEDVALISGLARAGLDGLKLVDLEVDRSSSRSCQTSSTWARWLWLERQEGRCSKSWRGRGVHDRLDLAAFGGCQARKLGKSP